MSERSRLRLVVLQVLVLSLLATLLGRMWYLQVAASENYKAAAAENGTREIVTPATRGMILDSRGRPLARNRTALVVSISRTAMLRQHDGGRALVAKVAKVIGQPVQDVWDRTRLCGSDGAPPAPRCFNGSPYQPIPVTDEASTAMALQIMERREDFPGVTAELTSVREYPQPLGANAAHELGYLGPVTDAELKARATRERPPWCEERDSPARHRPDRPDRPGAGVRRRPARPARRQDARGGPPGRREQCAVRDPADRRQHAGHHDRRHGAGGGREAAQGRHHAGPAHRRHQQGLRQVQGGLRRGGRARRADRRHRGDGQLPDVRPEHLGGWHQQQGLQVDRQQEEQLPEPVPRLPGGVRARLDVQGDLDAGGGPGRLLAERLVPLPLGLPDRRVAEGELRVRGVRHDLVPPGDPGVLRHGLLQVRLRDLAARGRAAPEEGRQGPVHPDGQGLRSRSRRPGSTCPARRTAGSPTGPGRRPTGGPPRTSTAPRRRPATPTSRRATRSGRPTCCSCPRRTASTAGPTAVATRPTSPSGRATRWSRRCSWPGSTPRSPTAAPW